jgi:hypothetical protein
MTSTESEEFRQAGRECLQLALKATEPELKASYEHLAESYQHVADKMTAWAVWIGTERVILGEVKSSLAAQKAAGSPSEQPQMCLWLQRSLSANNDLDRREITGT